MKPRSFFVNLFAGNLLLTGVIIALSFAVSYVILDAEYRRKDESQQDQLLLAVSRCVEREWPMGTDQADRLCKSLMESLPARLTIIQNDGQVLGDSEAAPRTMENHKTPDRPEILQALKGECGRNVRSSETLDREFRYFARPLRHGGRVVGVTRLAMPVRAVAEGREFIGKAVLWAVLVGAVGAAVLGLSISWMWSRPLRQITRAARRIASGDLSGRVAISGARELRDLSAALNEMRTDIAGRIQQTAAQREELRTVLVNLREGVVALDDGGTVVLMNPAAGEILHVTPEEACGQHVQTMLRTTAVLEVLDELASTPAVRKQIDLDVEGTRRAMDLHAARLTEPEADSIATLLVLRDITDAARTAEMKAEFVANASHELRTPLATIRAAVDSLSMIEPEDRQAFEKFLRILDRHCRRLESMTTDLMDLHLAEQARSALRPSEVRLDDLLEWVQTQAAPHADEKGVRLTTTSDDPERSVRTDRRLVELILQNLIDNAVKATPADGTVSCRLAYVDEHIVLTVADTGCGIPPDLVDRVFERFFQADRSRNGAAEQRGTGLGLAIVKHSVERLGGSVRLESAPNEGTTVTARFPEIKQGADASPV